MTKTATRKIEELEGLRGLAAVAVLLCHVSEPLQALGSFYRAVAAIVAPLGGLAVMVFFILSGFVIGYTNQYEWSGTNVRNYILRRLIRLYPIYLAALAVSFLVARQSFFSWQFLGHLVFLQGSFTPVIATNGPLWSLHYEFIYYLLYLLVWRNPGMMRWFVAISVMAVLGTIWMPLLAIKVLALFAFWLFGCWLATASQGTQWLIADAPSGRLWLPFFLVCANLSTGAWSGLMKRIGGGNGWELCLMANGPLIVDIFLSTFNRRLSGRISRPAYVISAAVSCAGIGYGLVSGMFTRMPCYPAASCFLVLALTSWVLRWSAPPLRFWNHVAFLGAISYGLYVIHYPLLQWLPGTLASQLGLPGACLIAVVVSFGAAIVLEKYLQPQIARYLKRWFPTRSPENGPKAPEPGKPQTVLT